MAVYSKLILAFAFALRCPAEETRQYVTSSTGPGESELVTSAR